MKAPAGRPTTPRGRAPVRAAAKGAATDREARLVLIGGAVVGGFGLALWGAGSLWLALQGADALSVPIAHVPALALVVLAHPLHPALAWPASARGRLPAPLLLYMGAIAWPLPLLAAVRHLLHRRSQRQPEAPGPASWAVAGEMRRLEVPGPQVGRLTLGTLGRRLVAGEVAQSLLVLGPTQSGKTSSLAIPALLEWDGPAIATSVKTDLVRDTAAWRTELGRVQVFDPTAVSGMTRAQWSPLASAVDWAGARRVAAGLCSVARHQTSGVEDGGFWYATAEKLLAPLLFAAATSERSMADVVRWVDSIEIDEVLDVLEAAQVPEALLAAEASFRRDARQLSSVYTTAETVLAAFADPTVLASSGRDEVRATELLDGGANTVYLVAPAREQERLAPVFVALLGEVLAAAFAQAESQGGKLARPLLVVLDEAANIAPLDDLDTLASTASAHGIQLVTIFQDLAQLDARYGRRGATVVNNHRAKLLCPGISDPGTLQQMSDLIGESEELSEAESIDSDGRSGFNRSLRDRRLAPADRLRRLADGEAVLLYGNLSPVRIGLRPFFLDRELMRRARAATGAADQLSGRRPARGLRERVLRRRRREPELAWRGSRRDRRAARRSGR